MKTIILLSLAVVIFWILFRPVSKKELKSFKIMTIGQIWVFNERKKMKKTLFVLSMILSQAQLLPVHAQC